MTIFYRGHCVRITHEVMEVWCPGYRQFAIRELRSGHVVEQPVAPPATIRSVRTGSTGVAGATAVAATLAWAEGWPALESPISALATLALLIVSIAVSGACWRVQPVERALAAVYRGRLVCLYRSRDAREFGQVRRALNRALEQVHDTL